MSYKIIKITDEPQMLHRAASWFCSKWGIPYQAYLDSMEQALIGEAPFPQWYMAVEGDIIIGGMGVIENDFHPRVDLSPNVCAVFVEPQWRCLGIAGELLSFVCADMSNKGINRLYLVTSHTGFYERYGWELHCMVEDEPGCKSRILRHDMIK